MQGVQAGEDEQRDEEVENVVDMYCSVSMLLFGFLWCLGERG